MKRKSILQTTDKIVNDGGGKQPGEADLLKAAEKKERQKKEEVNKAKHGAHHDMSAPGRKAADRQKSKIPKKR